MEKEYENDEFDNKIISISNDEKISLKPLFDNYEEFEKVEALDWGEPVGIELW